MLLRVWGIKSFSMYGDGGDIGDTRIAEQIGHQSLGRPFEELYRELTAAPAAFHVKTHEIPTDGQRAIYIVRDGRSASRSYCRYRQDFNGCAREAETLRDVILGFTAFGSWSNHLDAWDPLNRPGTLLLKYEDLLESPREQIPRIAEFIGLEPRQSWQNNFEELARLEPRYFRAGGANRPEEALAPPDRDLFWMLHAPWMRRLGYISQDFDTQVPEMPDLFRRSLYHAVADQLGRIAGAELRAQALADELDRARSDNDADRRSADETAQRLRVTQAQHNALRDRLDSIARSRVLRAAKALRLAHLPNWFGQR